MKKIFWGIVLFRVSVLLFYFCFEFPTVAAADTIVPLVDSDHEDMVNQLNRIEQYRDYIQLVEEVEQQERDIIQILLDQVAEMRAEFTPRPPSSPEFSLDLD